jgi:hypothetical protein
MNTSIPEPTLPPVRPPLPRADITREVVALLNNDTRLLGEHGRFRVFTFIRAEAPSLFHELARQREITFRAAAQGSGTDWDATPEDDSYTQLLLWDTAASRIAGAYRIGFTGEVLPEHGIGGLYLSHMFHFGEGFFRDTGPAMELSRSFIVPDDQRDPLALSLLWQGLGKLTTRHPEIRSLFGAVTISANYSEDSRDLLLGWLARHRLHSGPPLATARKPWISSRENMDHITESSAKIDALRAHLKDTDGNPMPVPPLIRHYLQLGATFHAFHREKSFGDAIYCLLDVRLANLSRSQRRRFTES